MQLYRCSRYRKEASERLAQRQEAAWSVKAGKFPTEQKKPWQSAVPKEKARGIHSIQPATQKEVATKAEKAPQGHVPQLPVERYDPSSLLWHNSWWIGSPAHWWWWLLGAHDWNGLGSHVGLAVYQVPSERLFLLRYSPLARLNHYDIC